jgi:hypothetical protein
MTAVEKLIGQWKAGLVSRYWLCDTFLSIVSPENVGTAMSQFPRECLDLLRELAASDPGPEPVSFGGGPTRRNESVAAIRSWFEKHPQ